jgi:hypothetical protein
MKNRLSAGIARKQKPSDELRKAARKQAQREGLIPSPKRRQDTPVPLGALGRSEFVATVPGCALGESESPRPRGYPFAREEAGSHFKRLGLRNKLLVECTVEDP